MEKKIGKVWSVFPLCGKTYCTDIVGVDAVDSDSSQFYWKDRKLWTGGYFCTTVSKSQELHYNKESI